jgi:hypothetical protein
MPGLATRTSAWIDAVQTIQRCLCRLEIGIVQTSDSRRSQMFSLIGVLPAQRCLALNCLGCGPLLPTLMAGAGFSGIFGLVVVVVVILHQQLVPLKGAGDTATRFV